MKFLWHLERQKRNTLLSLRTKQMPCPGYTVLLQKKHLSKRIAAVRQTR